jgi:hypothetical protein
MLRSVVLFALLAVHAHASSLLFTLSPAEESGQTTHAPVDVFFSGTLTDTDTTDTCDNDNVNCLYLNFISFTFDQSTATSHLSPDTDQFYLANVPGFLSDDGASSGLYDTYTGNIFGINIAPDTPIGTYTGTVSIYGGYDDSQANNLLASQTWTVVASPEPADFGLAMAGLAALVLAKRRMTG